MKPVNWKDIAELIGVAAIVASLVFVGLQMNQSDQIALSEIYQTRTVAVADWNLNLASNEDARSAFAKSAAGRMDDITDEEASAASAFILAAMIYFDNSHYQHGLGFLPDEHWERARRALRAIMRDPIWRTNIDAQKVNLRTSFIEIVEEIEREIDGESAM